MTLPERLPSIAGRRGVFVRIAFWLFVAVTAIGIAGSLWYNARDRFEIMPTTVAFGFRTYLVDGGTIVGERTPEAAAAGLRDGDLIVAVGGKRLPRSPDEIDVSRALRASPPATMLTVSRGGQELRFPVERAPHTWSRADPGSGVALWLVSLTGFAALELSPLVLIVAAGLLVRRRPRDSEALLFATGFLGLCWTGNVMQWLAALASVPLDLFTLSVNLAWCALFVAIAGFPDGRFATFPARLVAAAGVVLAISNLPLRLWPAIAARFDDLWVASAAVVLGVAALALVLRFRRAAIGGIERQQIKWVTLGFTIACVLKLASLALQRVAGVSDGTAGFLIEAIVEPLNYTVIALGLLVSLLRYRLYDAEVAISRSAAYAMLTLSLVVVFTATEKIAELIGQEYLGNGVGTLAGGIGAAVMIAPLYGRIVKWAEHRFQKNLIRLTRGLPDLVGDLRETATIDELAGATVACVDREMPAIGAALLADDRVLASLAIASEKIDAWRRDWIPASHEALDCVREDPIFPMRVPLVADGVGLQGWLLLGPRPDGSLYGKDERAALAEIAGPVARAIAIVRRREQVEADARTERGALADRVTALETIVERLIAGDPRAAVARQI